MLQGVSVLMSVRVNDWQHNDIVNDIDDLMEDWQKYVSEGGESLAL